jgi:hypothetical protein
MKHRFEISWYVVSVVLCAATLAVLVNAEGWIWPLQAAAVLIPVSLLIG